MSNKSHTNSAIGGYIKSWGELWNRFWFTPGDPAVLGVLRVLVGSMLLYTHVVWSLELATFFGGEDALLPASMRETLVANSSYRWSHFDLIGQGLLWPVHIAGLIIFALFMVGAWTRVTGLLSAILVISYANRATGVQFGLDQINCFLAVYLALGPSGQFLSVDRWLQNRGQGRAVKKSTMANVSLRLIQVHLCIVYLFAGMGKLLGDRWWNGDAIWGAVANFEYQTLELTWLAEWMWVVNLVTYAALIWEVSYPFLIWPKLTRPLILAMAICVHLGIGITMGMMTFGLIMVYANLSFVSSEWLRGISEKSLPSSLL